MAGDRGTGATARPWRAPRPRCRAPAGRGIRPSSAAPRSEREHVARSVLVDRQQADRDVAHHLDHHAAEADQHERPELRVLAHAEDHLDARRPSPAPGTPRRARGDRAPASRAVMASRGGAHRRRVAQSQRDAADLGLVARLAATRFSPRPEIRYAAACAAASSGVLPSALFGGVKSVRREQRVEAPRRRDSPRVRAARRCARDAAPQRRRIADEALQRAHGFRQAVDERHAGFALEFAADLGGVLRDAAEGEHRLVGRSPARRAAARDCTDRPG